MVWMLCLESRTLMLWYAEMHCTLIAYLIKEERMAFMLIECDLIHSSLTREFWIIYFSTRNQLNVSRADQMVVLAVGDDFVWLHVNIGTNKTAADW